MSPQESTPSLPEGRRLAGVFFEPGQVFADIAARGRWWLVLVILIALNFVAISLMVSRVGYDNMIQKAFENSKQIQQMSADQRQQAFETQRRFMPLAVRVGPPVAILAAVLVIAGVLLFVFKFMLDAELGYRQVLNITCYASLPPSLLGNLAFLLVLFLKDPSDFDAENASGLNAGMFLSSDSAAWLKSLAGSLDLFTFWTIALLAIGLSAALGARKMPFGRALGGVVLPWLIYVAGKAGFAALFR